jgi:hypothetical protein
MVRILLSLICETGDWSYSSYDSESAAMEACSTVSCNALFDWKSELYSVSTLFRPGPILMILVLHKIPG